MLCVTSVYYWISPPARLRAFAALRLFARALCARSAARVRSADVHVACGVVGAVAGAGACGC